MDKKDIYEHLAKIYLDASVSTKKHSRKKNIFTSPLFVGGGTFFALTILSLSYFSHLSRPPKNSEIALFISPNPVKINFNFDPAKKEVFLINLNNLNMLSFKALDFMVRKSKPGNRIALRVEFTNVYNERSELYFRDIPHRWYSYRVGLADFKNVRDWSCMRSLAFVVEEWNSKDKNGMLYVDNVKFLR